MIVKGIVDEDFSNYKKCSMFVVFPHCTLKCDHENGTHDCHNSTLLKEQDIQLSYDDICQRYLSNPLSHALVLGGLEPFDNPVELSELVCIFRLKYNCDDDIVIYTGFREDEINKTWAYSRVTKYKNIIMKFGRFKPNQEPHYDEVLGVNLANDEQYAKRVGAR